MSLQNLYVITKKLEARFSNQLKEFDNRLRKLQNPANENEVVGDVEMEQLVEKQNKAAWKRKMQAPRRNPRTSIQYVLKQLQANGTLSHTGDILLKAPKDE